MARRRAIQIGLWFLLGPLMGILQTAPSFLPGPIFEKGNLITLSAISVVYGTSWLTSAFLLGDILFLRRPLEAAALRKYGGIIALVALLSGLVFRQFLIMIGHPITAAAILFIGYTFRKKPSASEADATDPNASAQRHVSDGSHD